VCANQLAAGTLPALWTVEPQVVVAVGLEDLVDPATGPGSATTGFGHDGVRGAAARRRGPGGWPVMPASPGSCWTPTGAPLDLGRDHRVVTPSLRRAVERRDCSCVFTGCGAPIHWCDMHHSAAPGGPR
jgi:hypothetical protein